MHSMMQLYRLLAAIVYVQALQLSIQCDLTVLTRERLFQESTPTLYLFFRTESHLERVPPEAARVYRNAVINKLDDRGSYDKNEYYAVLAQKGKTFTYPSPGWWCSVTRNQIGDDDTKAAEGSQFYEEFKELMSADMRTKRKWLQAKTGVQLGRKWREIPKVTVDAYIIILVTIQCCIAYWRSSSIVLRSKVQYTLLPKLLLAIASISAPKLFTSSQVSLFNYERWLWHFISGYGTNYRVQKRNWIDNFSVFLQLIYYGTGLLAMNNTTFLVSASAIAMRCTEAFMMLVVISKYFAPYVYASRYFMFLKGYRDCNKVSEIYRKRFALTILSECGVCVVKLAIDQFGQNFGAAIFVRNISILVEVVGAIMIYTLWADHGLMVD
ncbi:hypothetical protein DICA1_C14532 [Diutina catenulata]